LKKRESFTDGSAEIERTDLVNPYFSEYREEKKNNGVVGKEKKR